MNNLAFAIDVSLYVIFVATIALIAYKVIHLYTRRILKINFKTEDFTNEKWSSDKKEALLEDLESGMTSLAAIASTAPFIGLVGTILHIIEALTSMSSAGIDISIISGPIATALNATLVGMASAIPATIAYSFFQRKIQLLSNKVLK